MDQSKKPRLAIITTWNEVCGIAHYTACLKPSLEEYFDIDNEFDLILFNQLEDKLKSLLTQLNFNLGDSFWKNLGHESVSAHFMQHYLQNIAFKLNGAEAIPYDQREQYLKD